MGRGFSLHTVNGCCVGQVQEILNVFRGEVGTFVIRAGDCHVQLAVMSTKPTDRALEDIVEQVMHNVKSGK